MAVKTALLPISSSRLRYIIPIIALVSCSLGAQEITKSTLLDAEQAFQVAKQASAAGDLQTAIIALERILIISPGLPNIQFELGLLYKRVGALRRAEYFFQESMKSEEMPPEIRARAESELAELNSEESTGRFNYSAGLGLQFESNAGSVPKQKDGFDPGVGTYRTGDSVEKAKSDGSLRARAGTSYQRRFGGAARHSWSAGTSVSTSRYFDQTELSSSTIGIDFGSTYALGTSTSAIKETATPFVNYALGFDENEFESGTAGIGLRLQKNSEFWSFGITLQASAKQYDNRQTAQVSDQNNLSAGLNFGFREAGSKWSYVAKANLASLNSVTQASSYSDTTFSYSATYDIDSIENAPRASVTGFIGTGVRQYDALDLQISDTEIRKDTNPKAGVILSIPFSNGFGFTAGVQTSVNRSNLSNFRYRNNTASVGVNWRF